MPWNKGDKYHITNGPYMICVTKPCAYPRFTLTKNKEWLSIFDGLNEAKRAAAVHNLLDECFSGVFVYDLCELDGSVDPDPAEDD